MDMKTIVHNPRNKRRILHIEAPGCIVNIQSGLSDQHGNYVTRVDVRADECWNMPDLPIDPDHPLAPRQHVGIRVMPYPPLPGTPAPEDELSKLRRALDVAKLRLTEIAQPSRSIDYYESDPGFANENRLVESARDALAEIAAVENGKGE